MKLYLNKITIVIFFLTCLVYLGCVMFGYDSISEYVRSFVVPSLLVYYYTRKANKSLLIALFLVFYSIAETTFFYLDYSDLSYYVGNVSYSFAYGFMLTFILFKMQFSKILKRFPIHLIILFLFGGYLLFALDELPESEISDNKLVDYVLYSVYNVLFILVLVFSLINYLYHDIKKALILFLACLCIVLSELVQVAYVVEIRSLFNVLYSFLLTVGFCFLFFYFNYGDKTRSIDLEVNLINA